MGQSMSILGQLSSQVGERTEAANRVAAARCLQDQRLFYQVVEGLVSKDAALLGDCLEVLTKVAEARPELVAPFVGQIVPFLSHRTTRVRWEAAHALALVAALAPEIITPLLPQLRQLIHHDGSRIMRDYLVEALGRYAQVGAGMAEAAYPLLVEALTLWDGKQTSRALDGMRHVAAQAPALRPEIIGHAAAYLTDGRGTVQKAAKAILKLLDG
jgi:hypothetical protein